MQNKPPYPLDTFIIAVSGMHSYEFFCLWTGLPCSPCKTRQLSKNLTFKRQQTWPFFIKTIRWVFKASVKCLQQQRVAYRAPCTRCHYPKPSTIHTWQSNSISISTFHSETHHLKWCFISFISYFEHQHYFSHTSSLEREVGNTHWPHNWRTQRGFSE